MLPHLAIPLSRSLSKRNVFFDQSGAAKVWKCSPVERTDFKSIELMSFLWLSKAGFRLVQMDQLASKCKYDGPVGEDHLSYNTDRDAEMVVWILD